MVIIFLPKDEYKKQRMIIFLAESPIVIIAISILLLIFERLANWNIDIEIFVALNISIFFIYNLIRYILSGIEYTSIFTKEEVLSEVKIQITKSLTFFIVFLILYLIVNQVPNTIKQWIETISVPLLAASLLFILNFISLNRSFRKNKKVLD